MAAKKSINTKSKSEKARGTRGKSNLSASLRSASLLEYFRAGESYTSLVLGIIVVIIASVLLLSLFKTRPDSQVDLQKGTTSISTVADQREASPTPTLVAVSNVSPKAEPSPTKPAQLNKLKAGATVYTIVPGDDLWAISVKVYGDGYRWTEIARANNLTDPSLIHAGNKLTIPSGKSGIVARGQVVEPTEMTSQDSEAQKGSLKISGVTYTIESGDDLWDIAVRAYGDGYKWVDIAKANNLTDPNLIFSGNILKLPR
jgi:putative chitinase